MNYPELWGIRVSLPEMVSKARLAVNVKALGMKMLREFVLP